MVFSLIPSEAPRILRFEGFDGAVVAYRMPRNDSDGNETFYVGVLTSD